MKEDKPYEQFGEEWQKEMMKKPKSFLVDFLANVCKRCLVLERQIAEDLLREAPKEKE